MVVEKLGQVIYPVSDMEASFAFYRDVVGLRMKFRDGDRWASFDCGSVTFALAVDSFPASGTAATSRTGGGVAAFRVDDLHGFARLPAVMEQDARVVEGAHELLLEMRDPDDNKLVFYQPKPA